MLRTARPIILPALFAVLASALIAWSPAALGGQIRPAAEAGQAQGTLSAGPSTRAGLIGVDDLLAQVLAAGKLVVATDPNNPPYSFLNDHGDLDGFDVEVAKEVARRLGVLVEFRTPTWDEVVAGNWGSQWDVSIGSMTPTDERALVLWFTNPYYYRPGSFALHQDNTDITTVDQLSGKRLGIGTGTPCQAYLNGELDIEPYGGVIAYPPPSGINVIPYDSDVFDGETEAILDLAQGDGVILDAVMANWVTVQRAIFSYHPLKLLGDPAYYEPKVFALDQARGPSDEMLAALNHIIADMQSCGGLARASGRWFGYDISEPVPPHEVPSTRVFLPLVAR